MGKEGVQMAQAGTTIELKAGSGRQMGFWLAFITAAAILAIGLAVVMTQLNTGSSATSGAAPLDRSYEQVEHTRGLAPLTGAPVDRSYDSVEKLRAGAGGAPAQVCYAPSRTGGAVYVIPCTSNSVGPAAPVQKQFTHAPGRGQLP
jgi:hypothetical protein